MRSFAASVLVLALASCASPARAPSTVVIPPAPPAHDAHDADRTSAAEADPDRDALLGTWLETLKGHQCNDKTTVRVLDGELAVHSVSCAGGAIYVTESVKYANKELELSFRDARSGATLRYHLTQTSRRQLSGELAIEDPDRDGSSSGPAPQAVAGPEARVFQVTWTKPR